jgi:hypothetical protein
MDETVFEFFLKRYFTNNVPFVVTI